MYYITWCKHLSRRANTRRANNHWTPGNCTFTHQQWGDQFAGVWERLDWDWQRCLMLPTNSSQDTQNVINHSRIEYPATEREKEVKPWNDWHSPCVSGSQDTYLSKIKSSTRTKGLALCFKTDSKNRAWNLPSVRVGSRDTSPPKAVQTMNSAALRISHSQLCKCCHSFVWAQPSLGPVCAIWCLRIGL